MRAQIQNFRGLSDLTADIAPILLLAGANGAGKSSACSAIAAVASGLLIPFKGVTKKSAGLLVHDGKAGATALLTTEEGSATVAWPAVERATEGVFRDASSVAVGLDDLTAMVPIDRASHLINLIGASPTQADLTAALSEVGIEDEENVNAIWTQVKKGWDAAHAFYKEEGAKLKGQWEKLTGERFGTAKAQTWRPKDWVLSLEGASTETLLGAVIDAEAALNDLRAQAGADEATVAALKAEAEQWTVRKRALDEAKADLEKEQQRVIVASAEFSRLGKRPSYGEQPLICPCCEKPVRLVDGALVKADKPRDPKTVEAEMQVWDRINAEHTKAMETRDLAQTYVAAAQAKVDRASEAGRQLEAIKPASVGRGAVDAGVAVLEKAQRALAMKNAVIESMGLVERIQRRIAIVGILDKDGLRQQVLVNKLGDFNGRLVEYCGIAGWAPVHIDADMSISYGGRPFALCSAGEQFRAAKILQVTIAMIEVAPLVVIDGADILDRAGRNGLLSLLSELGIPAVVGMTVLRREDMPDLARAGLGRSVWIEDGHGAASVKEAA